MTILAWAFVLVIFVPALGLILAELVVAPEREPELSRLDLMDRRCHYCDRAPGEGHGLVVVNGSPNRCPVTLWGRR